MVARPHKIVFSVCARKKIDAHEWRFQRIKSLREISCEPLRKAILIVTAICSP